MTSMTKRFLRSPAHLLLLAVSVALTLLPAGCKKTANDETEKAEVIVQAEQPKIGAITEEISADAVLVPVAQAAILPRISAPVRRFYVQRGSRVKAGQLLATLENSDLVAAANDNLGVYDAAKGTYATATGATVPEEQTRARLEVTQARAALTLDSAILKSRQQLLAQGAISGRDVDTQQAAVGKDQAAYDIAQQHLQSVLKVNTNASIEVAKGNLTSARAKYQEAQAQLGYTNIRSPISGVVTERALFDGETASAGTPLLTVMDTSVMIAKLHIAQVQAQQLAIGAPAMLIVPGMDQPVAATVSLVSPALDAGSTTVEVWLKAPNPAGRLKAGTPLHVRINGRRIPDAMLIPTEAVQRSSEGGGKVVLLLGSDGRTKKREITTGVQTGGFTQVLSGLQAGDMVITGGGYGLDEGTRVKAGAAEKQDDDGKAASGAKPADEEEKGGQK